ncbi:DUF3304 domain-containing protein [Rhodoferax aquaticus]|nr:DUF3304 domain-containing protein [Rhodoferax aquaticus]
MQRNTQRAFTCATLALAALVMGCAHRETFDERLKRENPELWETINREAAIRKSQETPTIGVGLECVRHGGPRQDLMPYVQGFWVQEVPYGQGSIGMRGGDFNCGGTIAGGYTIPRTWRPGMKVKVKWYTDGWDESSKTTGAAGDDSTKASATPVMVGEVKATLHEYTTTIPYYAKPGAAYVHLFRNGQARVIITDCYPEYKCHPIPLSALEPPPEVE